MKKWVVTVIVVCALIVLLMSSSIKLSSKEKQDFEKLESEPEEFNAVLTIEDVLPYCYSSEKCILDYISGKIRNDGKKVIRSGQISYTLYRKNSDEKIAEYLDPIPSGFEGEISTGESRQFISKKVFLTKAVPQGVYTLQVTVIDSLTEKIIALEKKDIQLKELTPEELLEETDRFLNK